MNATPLIFVPLLAMTAIVAIGTWGYVAHTFVHIVEETANGNDEYRRSDEPFTDWLWQTVFVASFVLIWGAPGFLLGEWTSHQVPTTWRPLAMACTFAAILWLMFPISFLSSMSSAAKWMPLTGGVIVNLLRRLVDTFAYFALTGVLVGLCAPLLTLMVTGHIVVLFVGGLVLGLAVVLYARLTGRMAFVVRLSDAPVQKKKRPKPKRPRGTKVSDPWEVPEEVAREEREQGHGFIQPRDLPTITGTFNEEHSGYDVSFQQSDQHRDAAAETTPPVRSTPPASDERPSSRERKSPSTTSVVPDALELKRLTRGEEKRLRHPWVEGIWSFPLQPLAMTQWCIMSMEFIFLGLLARGLIATWPTSGE